MAILQNRDGVTAFDIRTRAEATAREMDALGNAAHYMGSRLNLAAYVRGALAHAFNTRDASTEEALSAFAEINEQVRNRSGETARGTWVPLAMLQTRDIGMVDAALTAPRPPRMTAKSFGPATAVIEAGATVLTGLSGASVGLPYLAASPAVNGWRAEDMNAAIDEPTFGTAQLMPKSIMLDLVISRRLLLSTEVDLNALLRSELASRIGRAIDRAALVGDGNAAPLGVLNRDDLPVLSLGADGAAVTYADLAELERMVRTGAESSAPLAWVASPDLAKKLRLTSQPDGRPLFDGATMLGHPVHVTTNAPNDLHKGSADHCSALLLGDFSELVVGFWHAAAIDLFVNPVTDANSGRVHIVASADLGITARRIGAFAAIADALTS